MGKPKDPMGQHARLYRQVIDSNAWRALSFSARALYVQLRGKLNSANNGQLTCTLADFRHHGFNSSSTISAALRALQAVGLIEKTVQGGLTYGGKAPCRYRFTDQPVLATHANENLGVRQSPATKEWLQFSTLGAARAAIRDADLAVKRPKAAPGLADTKVRESTCGGSKFAH